MVMKPRSAVGVVMIWLATVAGVSVTAWVAIDRAGRDVTTRAASSLPLVTASDPDATRTPAGGKSSPVATQEPTATGGTTATQDSWATPEPSESPAPSESTTSATDLTSVPRRDRTLSVAGGQVSVRCTGATIALRIAQPDNGWRVEVDKSGPEEVEVRFRAGDREGGGVARVTSVCTTGTPRFTVENED